MSTDPVIRSQAPARVDLAGGTLDIWPIYLMIDRPVTVNLAVDLPAQAELTLVEGRQAPVVLRSEDQGAELKLRPEDIDTAEAPPALMIHLLMTRKFLGTRLRRGGLGLTLATRATSPAGAGLGGSSAVTVALVGALGEAARKLGLEAPGGGDREALIAIARDIECRVLRIPAGLQDFYGAMYGGLQALRWEAGATARRPMDASLAREVAARTRIYYSGQSRNSGINNWQLFKDFIDDRGGVRAKFEEIGAAAARLADAIDARDWSSASNAISEEWGIRKGLAAGISTPLMEKAFAAASALGRVSHKVCGAGGGGCFFLFSPEGDESLLSRIDGSLAAMGLRRLAVGASLSGLSVAG